jgi:hypothetical protein
MIFFGVIVSLFMHHGIAGFPPHPSHNPSERGVLFRPPAKGGLCFARVPLRHSGRASLRASRVAMPARTEPRAAPALGAGLMTPPSTRPEVCPARTEPRPPAADVAPDAARSIAAVVSAKPLASLAQNVMAVWMGDSIGDAGKIGIAQSEPGPTASQIKEALKDGKYPWYDPRADRVQPVRISWLERLGERISAFFRRIGKFFDRFHFGGSDRASGAGHVASVVGNSIGTVLLLAAVVAFFVCIFMLWIRREGAAIRGDIERTRLGTALRLGDLPEGIRPDDADPWAEAKRRRAAGDLAGAVVCLFAHQLLTLDQMGLIRLAPGRTGRHYLQSLRDAELIDALGSTLRLFEEVYYGRRSPNTQAFDLVWSRAQLFQERQRTLGARMSP